jgi:peptide/nickel transport system permease protein
VRIGGALLVLLTLVSMLAPWLGTVDPTLIDPVNRDLLPGARAEVVTLTGESFEHRFWMGSDSYGRDIYSRVLYGGRVSLVVGIAVALLSLFFGLIVGLTAGFLRRLDAVVMRVMDGLMAIPGILLAIALVALWRPSVPTVILAITVPEIPRVVRLVRAVVLTVREEPYVEAAIAAGTRLPMVLIRHVLPNCVPALIVQATYVCASAMLTEAILSFLGAGTPPEIPSWGNMMAEGRAFFPIAPRIILFPGAALALVILAVNVLGDGLRDRLDPKLARRV